MPTFETPATNTFLSRLDSTQRNRLVALLSPSVGAATLHHLEALKSRSSDDGGSVWGGRSSRDEGNDDIKAQTERHPPTRPVEAQSSAAQGELSDPSVEEETPRPSPPPVPQPDPSTPSPAAPPAAPLLTPQQLQLLLPALLPQARRWLETQQRDSLGQGVLHRELCELARYCLHLQQTEAKGMREREVLQQLVARQQTALLRSTKGMQALRVSKAEHQQAAEQAAAHGKLLERSLRAALRPSGLATRDASPQKPSASAAAPPTAGAVAAGPVTAGRPAPPTSRVVVARAASRASKTRRSDGQGQGQGRPAAHTRAGGRP